VTLNLKVGATVLGFYIRPNSANDPELTLKNVTITGNVQGSGQFGFLGVDLVDASLAVDQAVRFDLKLNDPGIEANDGIIHPLELQAPLADMAKLSITGNPSTSDLVVVGTFGVSALSSDGSPLFELGDARVTFTWADITKPEDVSVQITSPAAEQLLKTIQNTADDILDGLATLSSLVQGFAGTDVLGTKLPVLNKTLGEVL